MRLNLYSKLYFVNYALIDIIDSIRNVLSEGDCSEEETKSIDYRVFSPGSSLVRRARVTTVTRVELEALDALGLVEALVRVTD